MARSISLSVRGADCFNFQIHKAKAEKARERILKEEMDAKRAKTKAARERRQERITSKRNALAGEEEEAKKE
jgi:large subunit ribosomal protein L19e